MKKYTEIYSKEMLVKKFLECDKNTVNEFLQQEDGEGGGGGAQMSTSITTTPEGGKKKVELTR